MGTREETLEERIARINRQSMRNHPFQGDGPYCDAWIETGTVGDPATTGTITMRVGCGYPADLHPKE